VASAHRDWQRECAPPGFIPALSDSAYLENNVLERARRMWYNSGMLHTSIVSPIERVRACYKFRDERAVERYVESDLAVATALALVPDAIARYFPDARLALDVYKDREDPDCVILALRVMTCARFPVTRDRLKSFLRDWWDLHISDAADEKISVGVEPV